MADRIPCRIEGCERDSRYREKGLCALHYERVSRTGSPEKRKPIPNVTRFEARLSLGPGDCWTWTGGVNRAKDFTGDAYGTMAVIGRQKVTAHRWSYEYHIAPIPEGLEIDHLCRNTLCVNPWHLEPVTRKVNAERTEPARRTHCPRGHEYTAENTSRNSSGYGRVCRKCRARAQRERRANTDRPPTRSDFCKNGHPLSGDNLVEKSGIRVCRACRREAGRISSEKRWGRRGASTPPPLNPSDRPEE